MLYPHGFHIINSISFHALAMLILEKSFNLQLKIVWISTSDHRLRLMFNWLTYAAQLVLSNCLIVNLVNVVTLHWTMQHKMHLKVSQCDINSNNFRLTSLFYSHSIATYLAISNKFHLRFYSLDINVLKFTQPEPVNFIQKKKKFSIRYVCSFDLCAVLVLNLAF